MIYRSGSRRLQELGIILRGKANDAVLCRDLQSGGLYTVLTVKEHGTVKKLLELYGAQQDRFLLLSGNGGYGAVFSYAEERRLSRFYVEDGTPADCEKICLNLTAACMSCQIPWPLLYLILDQGQIHLRRDNSVELGYAVDLEELDTALTQEACVMRCAVIVRDLFKNRRRRMESAYPLLQKKIPRRGYREFRDLYADLKMAAYRPKAGRLRRLRMKISCLWEQKLIRPVMAVSCVLTGIVLVMLLSDLLWGDIPLLRLFTGGLRMIGTESLLK